MKEKSSEEQAKNILRVLNSQDFADWYNSGDFDTWISDRKAGISEEDILKQIIKKFHLK